MNGSSSPIGRGGEGGREPLSDEALAGHLERRSAEPAPRELAATIVARVADTEPERRWRLAIRSWRPAMAALVSAAALVLVVSVLYFGNPIPPAASGPLPTPSPAVTGSTWDPTERPLTPGELGRLLGTEPPAGTVLVVDDSLLERMVDCGSPVDCPNGALASNPEIGIRPPSGGHLPFPVDGSPIPGPVAVRVVDSRTLEFLGSVFRNGSGMAFRAGDLAKRSAIGGVFVVQSWISSGPPAPCPSSLGPPPPTSEIGLPAPDIGCVPSVWLTDEPFQSTSGLAPEIGLAVQIGAYEEFAPSPEIIGQQMTPRRGVFLVRDWAGYGEVLARLDNTTIPGPETTPEPTPRATPEPTPSAFAVDIVMSVDELLRRVGDGSLAPGAIAIADVPASAVSDFWAPGVVHSCPQFCPTWKLTAGSRTLTVDMFEGGTPIVSIVGIQAFIVQEDGSLRAFGPVANGHRVVATTDAQPDTGLWVVHGWVRLGVTQPLPCPAPQRSTMTGLLQEPLAWSGCPGAWIAVNPDGASGPGGIVLGDETPHGGIHVQDGAAGASFVPKDGVWLVRAVIGPCGDPRIACPSRLDSHPPIGGAWWELLGSVTPPEPVSSTANP